MTPNRNPLIRVVLLISICLLIGYWVGINKITLDWKNYKPTLSVISKEPPPGLTTVDFSTFWTVWQRLEAGYYDKSKLNSTKMLDGAISGLVESLGDPFTVYLPPTQNDNFKEGLAGQFQGIGAELGLDSKKIVVIAPLNGSPAQKAGIKTGDIIEKVDGEQIVGWSLPQAVERIRGPQGTTVVLSVIHKGANKSQDISIKRGVITIKSVDGFVKKADDLDKINVKRSEKIAIISLSQFGDKTNEEWTVLAKKISDEVNKDQNVKGMVLDLRNNPGGYLTDAVFIASEFLEEGTPVVIQEDASTQRNTLSVDRQGILLNIPLVVLVNKGSASAAEIVAGALSDNGRAKIVGEVTYGKGTIQQAEDLGGGAGLHVTIAKWLTPKGTWFNGRGLTPDIVQSTDSKDPSHDAQLEKAVLQLLK
jgi:carboxyl-terminal processing protease